ncbi:MAG: methionyl-tRNA formyltransferase [Rikenellaceae bacterium]
MDKKNFKIIYLGTPDFAVYPLKCLVEGGYNVVGVVSLPDKPSGRGQKINQTAVTKYAIEAGLKVLQPVKLKDEDFLAEMRQLDADLGIVVAFKLLPEVVYTMPKFGTFNLHGSILPDYRGAAPINWSIINGDTKTGVTTFMLDNNIDTGEIIDFKEVEITDGDNVGTIHDKLMEIGGELVLESVDKIISGNLETKPQANFAESQRRGAPKIFKDDCKIDWNNESLKIHNLIRGLSPYPAAWTDFGGRYGENVSMKIFTTEIELTSHNLKCGDIICDSKKTLKFATQDGFIVIKDAQLAGKKRMDIESLLRGCRLFD